MKKSVLLFVFIIGWLNLFLACSSAPKPKPLDLSAISEDIPISSISLIMNKTMDNNGTGENFIKSFYINNIGLIKDMLIVKGININEKLFLEEINKNQKIEFEEIKFSSDFIIHKYNWKSQSHSEIYINFLLNFVIQQDGTMPMNVTVKKIDPDYEPGYEAKTTLNLRFR